MNEHLRLCPYFENIYWGLTCPHYNLSPHHIFTSVPVVTCLQ